MERGSSVGEQLLHFRDKEISFSEESAHLEFVVRGAATQDPPGEVY